MKSVLIRFLTIVLISITYITLTTNIAGATLYDLDVLNIDFPEAPNYRKLSYEKNRYNGFTVHRYSTASVDISQVPYEIFSVSITTYDSLPSGYVVTDALSQFSDSYIMSHGSNAENSRFIKIRGKDALEVEYSVLKLKTRNIATFLIHGSSVITIEYECSGRQIKNYSPYRKFLKTLVLK